MPLRKSRSRIVLWFRAIGYVGQYEDSVPECTRRTKHERSNPTGIIQAAINASREGWFTPAQHSVDPTLNQLDLERG